MADELLERKQNTLAEILANVPKKDTYGTDHGSGNPNLQPGELRAVWKKRGQERSKCGEFEAPQRQTAETRVIQPENAALRCLKGDVR